MNALSDESKLEPHPNKEVAPMLKLACDGCGRTREIDLPWPFDGRYDPRPGDIIRGALVCSHCGGRSPFELREDTLTFKPGKQLVAPLSANAPDSVRDRYTEAEICLHAAAYRAAAVMARAAVEEGLKEIGFTERSLDDRIDEALKQGKIGKEEYSVAHGSRLIGNDAIHDAETVSPGEIPAVLAAAAKVVNHIF